MFEWKFCGWATESIESNPKQKNDKFPEVDKAGGGRHCAAAVCREPAWRAGTG